MEMWETHKVMKNCHVRVRFFYIEFIVLGFYSGQKIHKPLKNKKVFYMANSMLVVLPNLH